MPLREHRPYLVPRGPVRLGPVEQYLLLGDGWLDVQLVDFDVRRVFVEWYFYELDLPVSRLNSGQILLQLMRGRLCGWGHARGYGGRGRGWRRTHTWPLVRCQ